MSKFVWTFLSGSLLLIKSLYAFEDRPQRIAYKKNINSLRKKLSLDTGFTHLNFLYNNLFSSSYLTLSPKVDSKNWKLDALSWFSEQTQTLETFSIKEAYYTTSWNKFNFSIGRKLHEWTKEELLKPAGFWNNTWDFNKSSPELEGNFGVFIERVWNTKNKVNLFISPIGVPKLVTHNDVSNNGEVTQATAWSTSPPRQIEYEGLNLRVNYGLDDIDYLDLIQAFQVGATYDFSGEKSFLKLSYLYGPSKDLDLGLDFILDSSSQSTPVEIDIQPSTYNVHRLGLDLGFKWSKKSQTGLSINHRERADGIIEDVRQSYIGLSSGSVFQLYHKQNLLKNKLAFTAFLNENTQIQNLTNGELGELLKSYLSVPFRFVRGGGLKIESLWFKKVKLLTTLYYDLESKGVLGRLRLESKLYKKLNGHVGVEAVEALSDQAKGFYRDFRRNDFVYGGLSYAF